MPALLSGSRNETSCESDERMLAQPSPLTPGGLSADVVRVRVERVGSAAHVLRPSLNSPFRVGAGMWLWLLSLVAGLAATAARGRTTFLWSVAALGAVAIVAAGLAATYLRRAKIELDHDDLRLRLPIRTRRIPRDELGGIALRDVRIPGPNPFRRLLILYDTEHRCRVVTDMLFWSAADIDGLASWLGDSTPAARTTTYQLLAAEFPGSVSVWNRHPWRVTIGASVLAIALIIVIHAALT